MNTKDPLVNTFQQPANHCLECGKLLDAVSTDHDSPPKDGDISICIYCGALALFADDGTIWEFPAALKEEMKKNQPETWADILKYQEAIYKSNNHQKS